MSLRSTRGTFVRPAPTWDQILANVLRFVSASAFTHNWVAMRPSVWYGDDAFPTGVERSVAHAAFLHAHPSHAHPRAAWHMLDDALWTVAVADRDLVGTTTTLLVWEFGGAERPTMATAIRHEVARGRPQTR